MEKKETSNFAIWAKENPKKYFGLLVIVFLVVFKLFGVLANGNKTQSNSSNSSTSTYSKPCDDMQSYNDGVSFGRLQRGGFPDCDTYYYDGAAANKDCWCKGFLKGQSE